MFKQSVCWVIGNLIWRPSHFRTYREFQKMKPVMTTDGQTSRLLLNHYNKNGPNKLQLARHCHYLNELLQLEAVRKYIETLKEEYKQINNGVNYIQLAPLIPLLEEMQSSEKDLLELESMYKSKQSFIFIFDIKIACFFSLEYGKNSMGTGPAACSV